MHDILRPLVEHFYDYVNKFDSIWADDEEDESNTEYTKAIDGLFNLINWLFPHTYLYLAHEDGNDTSDSFYRCEIICDPSSGKRKEYNCYYSYGDGISRGDGDENHEDSISSCKLDVFYIDMMTDNAKVMGFDELAKKLTAYK